MSANLWVSEQAGFGAGFDEFVNIVIPRQPRTSQSLRDRMGWYLDALLARIDDGARATEEILARWIAEARTKPFFWFVNLCECHSPYLPPRPYNDLSMIRRLLAGRDARRYMTLAAIMLVNLGALEVPERSLDRMRHLYRQSIGLMDAWLGRILERLDDAGLLDNTEVIVTSDHGENLGEQGRLGHAIYLDERLIKVPFVAAGPLDLTTKGAMSLTDVPALLGSAFGLDHPWQPHAADGVVVAQYDSFGRRDDPRVQERLGKFDLSEQSVDLLTQDVTVAVDGTWKLISSEAGELAFNLVNDPGELSPVPIDNIPTPTLQALRAAVGRGQDRPAADQPAPPTEVPVADVADLEERMRMLGYL